MKLQILAFGIAKDIMGGREVTIDLEPGASVQDLRLALMDQFPAFTDLRSLAIAINNEYAREGDLLKEQDEIALIPPVSGG
jgi:molybdopterin converting factor subunit 1